MNRNRSVRLSFALAALSLASPAAEVVAAGEFSRKVLPLLPVERPYDFSRALADGREPSWRRNPDARPTGQEMALPGRGWKILIHAGAGIVLRTAADEFKSYLGSVMQTAAPVETRPSLQDWRNLSNAVVAGTREVLPGCGPALKGPKDYRIAVSPQKVVVCGFDERGVMYGLYNLEARMNLREAPFLPRGLDTTRHSLLQSRHTLSGLGWMEWPDRYLATVARYGFDSIFASVYTNPNGESGLPPLGTGRFPPYWDKWKKQDPARVHDVIRRAARFGLDVYCPIIFLYTGAPGADEAALRKLVRDIVTEFPTIRGYVLLTEGFAYKTWFGAGGSPEVDLKEWARNWVKMVEIVAEECHKRNPAIEVLVWEYNVPFRPDNVELKAYITGLLPRDTIPLITFENGKGFELDGRKGYVTDYSISQTGPSEVAAAQIGAAKARGMRVYSKADAWASWQFGTFPYIPAPYQWHARYKAVEEQRIDGTMESWSYGFKPNFIAEMRAWYSWSDAPPLDDLLRSIARREFGAGSEGKVLKAWDHFSRAVRLVPDTGPRWGTNNAVAAPFFLEKPEPRAMTVEHSWFNQGLWTLTARINPYWPFTWHTFFLWPDFSNKTNAAEQYTRTFTLPVFSKYLLLAAGEFEEGLQSYRQAALNAPPAVKKRAAREVLLADHMQRMLRSAQALLEFEDLRFRLSKNHDRDGSTRMLDRMAAILREEIARTELSLETARRDSRLGYEWEMDYVYTPYVLSEKLQLLKTTLSEHLPERRKTR